MSPHWLRLLTSRCVLFLCSRPEKEIVRQL
jgi:hypothetical protein